MQAQSLLGVCSQDFDHLGLVAAMCKRLRIASLIDQMVPPDPRSKVTHGQRVVAMLLNGLGFATRTLYLTPEFLSNKPLQRLIAPGVKPEHFNDDALGRTLDVLHKHDLTQLFIHMAAHATKELGLQGRFGHLDSSSFHVDGHYNQDNAPDENEQLIHITQGYSRDKRPDLNQVVLQLIVENCGGLPVLMKAVSGNQQDKKGFKELLDKHLQQLKQVQGFEYIVADSALYTRDNIQALHENILFITRMPSSLKQAQGAIHTASQSQLTALDDKLSYIELPCGYGNVAQRMVVVYSQENFQRAQQALNKQIDKQSKQETTELNKLLRQDFACEKDARQAIGRFQKRCKWLQLKEIQYNCIKHYKQVGRPSVQAQVTRVSYRIQATSYIPASKKQEALRTKGYFILVTNERDTKKLPAAEVIRQYKAQSKVERGFRFLKDPCFLSREFYVKKVERLMAVTFIMTLCLLVYAACEYELRQALVKKELHVANQVKKATQRPTIRWIFQCFIGIHLLQTPTGEYYVANLKPQHLTILQALGPPFERMYA